MIEFLKTVDFSPLFISLKTGVAATIISFFIGLYAARFVMKASPRVKAIVDGILTLPMILPPTVCGFFLLLLFSLRRPFGHFLYVHFDIKIIQSWAGCVIAAAVIALPLMYRNARAAFEQVDIHLVYAGRTLGLSERKIFWKIIIPAAAPGILSGTILAFARAIGEYGATSMLAGNILGKTSTVSQTIAMVIQDGNYQKAGFWVAVVLILGFIMIYAMNRLAARQMKNIRRW